MEEVTGEHGLSSKLVATINKKFIENISFKWYYMGMIL